jgi:hypothetical protein
MTEVGHHWQKASEELGKENWKGMMPGDSLG